MSGGGCLGPFPAAPAPLPSPPLPSPPLPAATAVRRVRTAPAIVARGLDETKTVSLRRIF